MRFSIGWYAHRQRQFLYMCRGACLDISKCLISNGGRECLYSNPHKRCTNAIFDACVYYVVAGLLTVAVFNQLTSLPHISPFIRYKDDITAILEMRQQRRQVRYPISKKQTFFFFFFFFSFAYLPPPPPPTHPGDQGSPESDSCIGEGGLTAFGIFNGCVVDVAAVVGALAILLLSVRG